MKQCECGISVRQIESKESIMFVAAEYYYKVPIKVAEGNNLSNFCSMQENAPLFY